jgi:siderophore synthetase component
MTKPELKEFIKKCFVEMLTEDFIQKSVNQIIKEKIVIEVGAPSFKIGKQKLEEDTEEDDEEPARIPPPKKKGNPLVEYKSKLSPADRKRMHQSVLIDGDPDNGRVDPSRVSLFKDPAMQQMAQDTVEHQLELAEQEKEKSKFTQAELDLVNPNRANAILDAVEKR